MGGVPRAERGSGSGTMRRGRRCRVPTSPATWTATTPRVRAVSSPFDLARTAAESRRVEVGEYRGSPGENNGVGGGGEGVGRHDHFAPLDAEMPQGDLEGGRAGTHADGVGDPHIPGKLLFEAVEELSLCEPAAAEDLAEILEKAVDLRSSQARTTLVNAVSHKCPNSLRRNTGGPSLRVTGPCQDFGIEQSASGETAFDRLQTNSI